MEGVGPGGSVGLAVAVVVAAEVVAAGSWAAGGCERYIDGGEEVVFEGGLEGYDAGEVLGC